MRIIGNGQLATAFQQLKNENNATIFASGVSDSTCTLEKEFNREKDLLIKNLKANKKEKFVYFSSCALSSDQYAKNLYYEHKLKMESLIKSSVENYQIFRIPQLFGDLKYHKTIINFLYNSIQKNLEFSLYSDAYRYVIEIEDTVEIVRFFIENIEDSLVIDLANPYRYNVLEIVNIIENILDKKAKYNVIEKKDAYSLDLNLMESHVLNIDKDFNFGKDYLYNKLKIKHMVTAC